MSAKTNISTQQIQMIEQRLGISALNPMQQFMLSHASAAFIILRSPTGSGKTLAFALPLSINITNKPGIRVLVIAPARELAVQIAEVLRRALPGRKVSALYGGHSVKEETQTLAVTPDIVVATPGRLLDHIDHGNIAIDALDTLVLDEWDKTLQLGFAEEMRKICRHADPRPEHVILTSATAVADLPKWLPVSGKPLEADFGDDYTIDKAPAKVDIVEVPSATADKLDAVKDLLMAHPDEPSIVFVNHRESAERVAAALRKASLPVTLYHGALDQDDRTRALDLFANGSKPVLVSTDLAARGLDIDGVHNVVHYHIPLTEDAWTHRNGRTGRMGADGTVYVITSDHDSIPEFIDFDRTLVPKPDPDAAWRPKYASLYLNAGKKDKISRGDIVGFLTQKGGLTGDQIGRISLYDHAALVAVDAGKARDVVEAVKPHKLKNKRVLVSLAKNT